MVFCGQNSPFLGTFFNLLGFLRKKLKIPQFSHPYQKIQIHLFPLRKVSGYAPAKTAPGNCISKILKLFHSLLNSKFQNLFLKNPSDTR